MLKDKPYTLDSVVRMLLGAGFVVALIWLLGYLSGALIPFVVALILAYLLNPLTSRIEDKVGSRGVAVFLTVIIVVVAVGGIGTLVVPMMAGEFAHMGKVLSDLATNSDFAARVRSYLPDHLWQWVQEFLRSEDVKAMFTTDSMLSTAQTAFSKIVPGIKGILNTAGSVVGGLVALAIIHLYFVFLLADFGRIKKNWQNYLPADYRESIVEFVDEFERTMSTYFRSQIIVALLVGALLSVGLLLVGLPMALLIGMGTGILNIAPYLGTLGLIVAIPLAALGSLEAGQSPLTGMGLTVLVFGVVQAIQDGFLVPRIQGESLGLSPWLILLSLSVWGQLLGFLGLLIALPMTCLCLSYYRRMLAKRELL